MFRRMGHLPLRLFPLRGEIGAGGRMIRAFGFICVWGVMAGLPVYAPAVRAQDLTVVAPSVAAVPADGELAPSGVVPSLADVVGGPSVPSAPASSPGYDETVPTNIPGLSVLPVDMPPEETPEQIEAKMRQEAYDRMMSGVLPMTPHELRDAFGKIDQNQKAIEHPLKFPKPEIAFTTLSLDPAEVPLTFKLATGHVTTVSFLDITGQPWPVKDVTWAGNFEIKSSDQAVDERFPMYPNLLRIIPLADHAYGNMSVRLLGLNTPITFTLRTNQDEVQYRLDLRVPEPGPFAMPSILEKDTNTLVAGNSVLTQIMQGVPPGGAKKMRLSGVDGRTTIYAVGDTMYVRTPLTMLSPAWSGSVRSADGMNVYALAAAPVLLLSDQGQMVRATLEAGEGE